MMGQYLEDYGRLRIASPAEYFPGQDVLGKHSAGLAMLRIWSAVLSVRQKGEKGLTAMFCGQPLLDEEEGYPLTLPRATPAIMYFESRR